MLSLLSASGPCGLNVVARSTYNLAVGNRQVSSTWAKQTVRQIAIDVMPLFRDMQSGGVGSLWPEQTLS